MPYSLASFLNVTVFLYKVFTKSVHNQTNNWLLALSRLMHNIYYGNAVFPYEAFERRPAQKTIIGCVGLHRILKH
jgi:hypothetical protein